MQGMGRHSAEEVRERAKRDLDACSVLLQKSGAYLSGATPCQADCFLFAVMHLVRPQPSPSTPEDMYLSNNRMRHDPSAACICTHM